MDTAKRWAGLSLPAAILLAEVLVFYRLVLFGDGFVIPWDLRYFHLPLASFIADSFRGGHFPLWDPFTYCGRPFYANLQAQVFYPPTLVAVLISNWIGADTLLYALEWQSVLHVWLAGVLTFWLLTRLGLSRWAALAGASIYQLGGFFASQAQHLVVVNAGAWLPLAWLAVLELRERIEWRWLAALAVSIAMTVLAGFPAVTVVVVGSSFLLALGCMRWRPLAALVISGAWAFLLAAIQLLPTLELHAASIAKYRTDWLKTGGGLPLAALVSLAYPNYYGIFDLKSYKGPWDPTFLYLYCSLAGILLALAAVLIRRTGLTVVFAGLTAVSALWMLGDSTPVGAQLAEWLPRVVRNGLHPEYAMCAFVLGVAVLAGMGVQRFFHHPKPGYAIAAVIVLDLILNGSGRPMNTSSLRQEAGITREAFGGSRELLDGVRRLANQTDPPSRIDSMNGTMEWSMCAPLTRVPSANGNDPLALERILQVRLGFCRGERWGRFYEIASPESPLLDLLNVRWVLSGGPVPGRLRKAADLPGTQVYENTQALPRFFLVDKVRAAGGMAEAIAALRDPLFDPRRQAIVEGWTGTPAAAGEAVRPTGVRAVRYEPDLVLLEVDSPAPAFLVTSEAWFPGWSASIDGQPRPLVLTNVAFRGLEVPAGRHAVRMEFAPSILWKGAALSGLGWALLAAALAAGNRVRSRWWQRRPAGSSVR